jgi:hypothetical protein
MSQIIAMANRLQEAEKTIIRLKEALETGSSPALQQTDFSNPSASPALEARTVSRNNPTQLQGQIFSKEPTSEELLLDLSLDEHGKVS